MTITAKIICDSVNPLGTRLISYELRYPRFIHAEFMTHRSFSRCAASSRAINMTKYRENVINDPAMFVFWGKNQKGMQSTVEMDPNEREKARQLWIDGMCQMANLHAAMEELGIHKQNANRILEPWAHITVIATCTEINNFFSLRCHPDAQPEFQDLAHKMQALYNESTPLQLGWGGLHLPYVSMEEFQQVLVHFGPDRPSQAENFMKAASVGRCAGVSYLIDGNRDMEAAVNTFNKLIKGKPLHASPLEHVAIASPNIANSRNFHGGWLQYREEYENQIKTEQSKREI